jgi:hypothetical protein
VSSHPFSLVLENSDGEVEDVGEVLNFEKPSKKKKSKGKAEAGSDELKRKK